MTAVGEATMTTIGTPSLAESAPRLRARVGTLVVDRTTSRVYGLTTATMLEQADQGHAQTTSLNHLLLVPRPIGSPRSIVERVAVTQTDLTTTPDAASPDEAVDPMDILGERVLVEADDGLAQLAARVVTVRGAVEMQLEAGQEPVLFVDALEVVLDDPSDADRIAGGALVRSWEHRPVGIVVARNAAAIFAAPLFLALAGSNLAFLVRDAHLSPTGSNP
jgi:hypothetical protein